MASSSSGSDRVRSGVASAGLADRPLYGGGPFGVGDQFGGATDGHQFLH